MHDLLKLTFAGRLDLLPSSAREAENEYKATVVQMRSTLDTYRDQLASELAELRAQVCQTKTGEPSRCPPDKLTRHGEAPGLTGEATVNVLQS